MTSETAPIADADQDNPVAREQWFMKGRTAPPGQSAANLRYRAHQRKMQMRARRGQQSATAAAGAAPLTGAAGWQSLGPAPMTSDAGNGQDYSLVSGRVNAVAIDPADSTGNTVYVGGAFGGLWRSTNAASGNFGNTSGVSWTSLTDNQPTLSFGAIAIQPGNATGNLSNVIVLGTGEANAAGDSYYGLGFLRSSDHGQTWQLISTANSGSLTFKGLAVSRMAFSTASNQILVAGVAGDALGAETGAITSNSMRGLYTSTDAGQNWTLDAPTDAGVPIDHTSATSVAYNASAPKFYAAIRYHGFYSSPDGINWTRLVHQPGALSTANCPPSPFSTSCPIYRGEIAVVPGRNEMYVWYVSIQTNGQVIDQGVWRSQDGGNSWGTAQINENGLTNCGDPQNAGCGVQQAFFNMSLAAVANGTATDLYAGAVNEFKCPSLTSSSTTCGGAAASWLNLTHVYGCPSIAKVHPDEHAVDFTIVSGKDVMYFGNDGGIYRALDGFTGLTTGTCGGTNQFDSLNATIGSMTQFVSMSEDPSNAGIILGGTQDNGSPATNQATTSPPPSWKNVNAGDGGFNEINPNNANEWFTANTDVSIQRCTSGINCTTQTQSFCQPGQFCQVVGNNNVGGDHGAFYTPYILDPQSTNNSELVVGTCRAWRGPGAGGTYTQLSNSFDATTGACTGNEVNLVRGLAAGGPTSGGLSNVIYATTEGFGPLRPANSPTGGQVFVTSNAAGGPSTWQNVTNGINPNQYVVSSVAVDTSDSTGKTAYVTIMGFGTPHVFQTTNAGANWTDFSGAGATAIPDAPANSIVIDSPSNTIYVGTDVGVFSSPTTGATGVWTEVGPAPSSGSTGFLPNVPVTKLRLFNSGGQKLLRASTYGRGIWQFTLGPDYGIAISNSPLSQLVTQPATSATFNGTVTADNGYSGTVNLACGSGAPSNCMVNPPSVTPTGSFTVTMSSNTSHTYSFNVNATGTDAAHTQHQVPVVFNSNPDFTLTSPSGGQAVKAGGTAQYSLTFTPTGADTTFVNAVTYTCSGLPTLSSCSFSPPQITAGTPAANGTVSLSIITTASHSSLIGRAGNHHNTTLYALWLSLPGIGIVFGVLLCDESRRKRIRWYSAPGLVLFLALFQVACGGGGSGSGPQPGTTPGTYTVTINATETVSHSTTVILTVQ